VVSQYLENPKPAHIMLVKYILQYLASNSDVKLVYKSKGGTELIGYVDASYANEAGYKSRSGFCKKCVASSIKRPIALACPTLVFY
jgi:hypothetical protein